MQILKPATISQRVGEQINASMLRMTHFYQPTDFAVLRWMDELKQLMRANAMEAYRWQAMVHHMTGDSLEMERSLENASRLGLSVSSVADDFLTGYVNLTMATKALPYYRSGIDIKNGNVVGSINIGVAVGFFQRALELLEQVMLAKLELPEEFNVNMVKCAADVLKAQNVNDDLCAQVVDAAGEVMRARKLFWLDQSPVYTINEVSRTVGLQYRVAVDHAEAASMTMETAEKLIERDLDTLPFYVTFLGSKA